MYRIRITPDSHPNYYRIELQKHCAFWGIPYWSTSCVRKDIERSARKQVSTWAHHFNVQIIIGEFEATQTFK